MKHQPQSLKICLAVIGELTEPLANMISKFDCNIHLHVIPFVEASSRSEWNEWLNEIFPNQFGIGLGSAGCFLAHRDAWESLALCKPKLSIVLEDDAMLTKYGRKNFTIFCSQLQANDFNLIHLGDHERFNLKLILNLLVKLEIRKLFKVFYERIFLSFLHPKIAKNQFPFSAHAYVISFNLMKILSNQKQNFFIPVDVMFNGISQVKNSRVGKVRTPLIVQSNSRPSHILSRGR